ncbi:MULTISPECIES: DAK2 domain-containing protein [Streptomyces diastaticus group]|uniref:DAK2 domain-containing protein n=1 Tax=Streptomyces rutgersensis TaxID=53451 RepID=A0ABX6RSR4_9ACTN|nr:DAK2 domain-containing protein [Streptomyces rutgersensis]QNE83419.1 DAK2 domain-containing protein [Streptomyces rutgersensis]
MPEPEGEPEGAPPPAPHPRPPHRRGAPLDAPAVRRWCALALDALGRAREDIDAINVYPVADGDTGTNLYLTVESAAQAVEAVFAAHETGATVPALPDAVRAMAHGALIGARGNSGTILAQLLRGMAQVLTAPREEAHAAYADGPLLAEALRRAADSAYGAVAHPVEGTVLTVATAAADGAHSAVRAGAADCAAVARAAHTAALAALGETPRHLAVLARAGVVDAGGRGFVTVLHTLVEALTGEPPARPAPRPAGVLPTAPCASQPSAPSAPSAEGAGEGDPGGPAYEVIYLLDADDAAVARLRRRLDALGDSLVVVGGDGLWNVHVHVDDAGAAVEAGIEAGRPHRVRITHFGAAPAPRPDTAQPPRERAPRAVVAVVPGEGLAELYAQSGATAVHARAGEPPASGELAEAIRRAHAHEVVLLPNDPELRHTAAAAAEQARGDGIRVALIPTRSAVQGIAALAVHESGRRFDEDVVAMTSAAGTTRHGEIAVAERQSWTTAGVCQAGDVLGLVDGDVAVIGTDLADTARTVLDRMLSAGGEMVTLVLDDEVPERVAGLLERHVRTRHLAVDTVVYRGGRQGSPMLIGVE